MKWLIKLAISLVVRTWDIIYDCVCRLLGKPLPSRCMVLYYHTVPAQHLDQFARQLDTILKLARPISTIPNDNLSPSSRYVSVTFDDGFLSVMQNAAPELRKRQIPWTIFVPSGHLGKKPAWLRQAHPAAREDRVMTAAELRQLSAEPLVTIGSHTVDHINLAQVDAKRVCSELADSKKQLENLLGKPVLQFSYPFGGRNTNIDAQARIAGYTQIFCSEPAFAPFSLASNGRNTEAPSFAVRPRSSVIGHQSSDFGKPSTINHQPSTFLIGRATVDPDMSPLEFRLKLLGAYRWQTWLHRAIEAPKH